MCGTPCTRACDSAHCAQGREGAWIEANDQSRLTLQATRGRAATYAEAFARLRPSYECELGLPLRAANPCFILNYMVQYSRARFDASFAALSDATRRGVLE